MIAACPKAASQEAVTALIGLDMTEELPEIRVPTLVLSGSADVIAPPAQGRRIAELIPDARLEVFKGAGHMLMLERTHDVNALISEFARDLGAGSPLRRFWARRKAPGRRAARRAAALAPREAAS
jgi:pimeloyl-ACP methyl ester carboxylesterase